MNIMNCGMNLILFSTLYGDEHSNKGEDERKMNNLMINCEIKERTDMVIINKYYCIYLF